MPWATNMVKQSCGRPSDWKRPLKVDGSPSTVRSSEAHPQVCIAWGGGITVWKAHPHLSGIWIIALRPSKPSCGRKPVPLPIARGRDWPWDAHTANVSSSLSLVGVEEVHHLDFANGTTSPAIDQWWPKAMTSLLVVFRMDSPESSGLGGHVYQKLLLFKLLRQSKNFQTAAKRVHHSIPGKSAMGICCAVALAEQVLWTPIGRSPKMAARQLSIP